MTAIVSATIELLVLVNVVCHTSARVVNNGDVASSNGNAASTLSHLPNLVIVASSCSFTRFWFIYLCRIYHWFFTRALAGVVAAMTQKQYRSKTISHNKEPKRKASTVHRNVSKYINTRFNKQSHSDTRIQMTN